jgi:hypothetical protein
MLSLNLLAFHSTVIEANLVTYRFLLVTAQAF